MAEFPVLFTIDNSQRHEVIMISEADTIRKLNEKIVAVLPSSPNAVEFMGKYRSKETKESIQEIGVVWGRGDKGDGWPSHTLVTTENWGALAKMLAAGVGECTRDRLNVKLSGSG